MKLKNQALVFIAAAAVCRLPLLAQQDFTDVQIKTIPVAGKVYMLEGSGGNIGVSVGSGGVLIVDDQYAPLSEKIAEALAKLGDRKPKFILNTHWHGDHTGGNEAFGKSGTIIAHTNVRKRLSTKQELFGRTVGPQPNDALPVITFDDSLAIHFNDEEIRAVHFPNSHTDGDIVIYFPESNVIHMGDLFFNGTFPFVDLDHGGSVQGLIRSVEVVLGMLSGSAEPAGPLGKITHQARLIPGHGPLADANDLKVYHQMLTETTQLVRDARKAGRSLDEIKAAGVQDKWAAWGNGFILTSAWLETIYNDLSR
jgi:glyoxylase-like metal-dependent hydrolase (beta-lactamase superfamily II)